MMKTSRTSPLEPNWMGEYIVSWNRPMNANALRSGRPDRKPRKGKRGWGVK